MKLLISGDFYKTNSTLRVDKEFSEYIDAADYSILNFEGPIVENKDSKFKIKKTGPNISMRKSVLNVFDIFSKKIICACANNHIGDYGENGIHETLSEFSQKKIKLFGVGENITEAGKPLILENRIAIINFSENEYGMARKGYAGANPFRVDYVVNQIRDLSSQGLSVIVFYHGGNEYCPIPNPRNIMMSRLYIDCGAKVVIGSHAHCPQSIEKYKDSMIFYGLGNFVFDDVCQSVSLWKRFKSNIKNMIGRSNERSFWDIGVSIFLEFDENSVKHTIVPTKYTEDNLCVLKDEKRKSFDNYINEISEIIKDPKSYDKIWGSWVVKRSSSFKRVLEKFKYSSIENKNKNYFPFENLLRCESHFEVVKSLNELTSLNRLNNYKSSHVSFYQNPDNFKI
mgnify:CR=1 FL=1|jgi:hypothetical protein